MHWLLDFKLTYDKKQSSTTKVNNLLDRLASTSYFNQIDLKLGYYQIRINEAYV